MATTKTLQDLRNIAYGIFKQPENSKAYQTVLLDSFLNWAQQDICVWGLINPTDPKEVIEKQQLPFLSETHFYNSIQPTSIVNNTTIGATSLVLSSTDNMANSGLIWIDWNIIRYSGITGTTLTWISSTGSESITFAWLAGAKVATLFDLPADYGQMTSVTYDTWPQWVQYRMISIDYRDIKQPIVNQYLYRVFRDDLSMFLSEFYYTIIKNKYFLPFTPKSNNALRFEYEKAATIMVSPIDFCSLEDEYSLRTIPYLAVAEMLINRWETDEGMKLWNIGIKKVKAMYSFYQTTTKELVYNQRIRTASDWVLNI